MENLVDSMEYMVDWSKYVLDSIKYMVISMKYLYEFNESFVRIRWKYMLDWIKYMVDSMRNLFEFNRIYVWFNGGNGWSHVKYVLFNRDIFKSSAMKLWNLWTKYFLVHMWHFLPLIIEGFISVLQSELFQMNRWNIQQKINRTEQLLP